MKFTTTRYYFIIDGVLYSKEKSEPFENLFHPRAGNSWEMLEHCLRHFYNIMHSSSYDGGVKISSTVASPHWIILNFTNFDHTKDTCVVTVYSWLHVLHLLTLICIPSSLPFEIEFWHLVWSSATSRSATKPSEISVTYSNFKYILRFHNGSHMERMPRITPRHMLHLQPTPDDTGFF